MRAAVAVEGAVVLQGRPGEVERVGRAGEANRVGSLGKVALDIVDQLLALVDVDFLTSLGQQRFERVLLGLEKLSKSD